MTTRTAPLALEQGVALLRSIESFGTVSFAARRLHLSQAEFRARLSALEATVGAQLACGDRTLVLTAVARRLLDQGIDGLR